MAQWSFPHSLKWLWSLGGYQNIVITQHGLWWGLVEISIQQHLENHWFPFPGNDLSMKQRFRRIYLWILGRSSNIPKFLWMGPDENRCSYAYRGTLIMFFFPLLLVTPNLGNGLVQTPCVLVSLEYCVVRVQHSIQSWSLLSQTCVWRRTMKVDLSSLRGM